MALYPYTLQPVDLNLTQAEFRQAQTQLFDSNNQQLMKIGIKTWVIVAIVGAIALAGIVFLQGYSSIIFWLMLVGVAIYLLARTYGLKWYAKQEFEKQMTAQPMPDEMKTMKIGIQQHGLVMSMPLNNMPKMPKGYNQPLVRGNQMQQAIIKWDNISNWQETTDFIVMMFDVQGQRGSQIIPKRLEKQKFPIETLKNHLQEYVGIQGFDLKDSQNHNKA
ncbi:hypothetical protein MOMA_05761 [Moraxella macacae 0408225]|uniref:YcxB-like C-terminal domain-containing protein n=1 Tax=Moraxella macacae 0408225 TaxID=1230338 RepID=L2F4V4_9GAMM|nr:YcxB family protein [Moraxella macacae]ELA08042.1 hypothetical protein MOMA_05761 [Moraxella macacae 0408225]